MSELLKLTRRERRHGEADLARRDKARIDSIWVNNQVEERYQHTLQFLTQTYPNMSVAARERQARDISLLNRADRRKNGIK